MKRAPVLKLVCLFVFIFNVAAFAGNLEPSGPPGSTMKPLDQVEPRIPITSVPFDISQSGSYYLTKNFNCTGTGILVEANDVTIDLMGYSLSGTKSANYHGIWIFGRTNVEIRNGTVRNFDYGVYENNISGKNHRIIQVRALSNLHDGINLQGSSNFIDQCNASSNGGYGIYTGGGSTISNNIASSNTTGIYTGYNCTVIKNDAYSNNAVSVYCGNRSTISWNTIGSVNGDCLDTGTGCTITNNTIGQGNYGILTSSYCTIANNTIYTTKYSAISADTSMIIQNIVSYANTNYSSTYGGICATSSCTIKGNKISYSFGGIRITGSRNVIEENTITNGDIGIFFNATSNYYGHNRLSDNGTNYSGTSGNTDGGDNVVF